MKVTKKELKRIAQMCDLSFSDSEFDMIKKSIKQAQEPRIIYQSKDYESISQGQVHCILPSKLY